MKIENGKIIEATEGELFRKYIEEDWDDCMPFAEYKHRMEKAGCKVKDENSESLQ